jgi:hypothetical protein
MITFCLGSVFFMGFIPFCEMMGLFLVTVIFILLLFLQERKYLKKSLILNTKLKTQQHNLQQRQDANKMKDQIMNQELSRIFASWNIFSNNNCDLIKDTKFEWQVTLINQLLAAYSRIWSKL